MDEPTEKNKGGRPLKLTPDVILRIYALHLGGFWAPEISRMLKKDDDAPLDLCHNSVRTAIRLAMDMIPRYNEKENLMQAVDACDRRMRDLTVMAQKVRGSNNNSWLGCQRELRENDKMKREVEGLLKTVLSIDDDSLANLYAAMHRHDEEKGGNNVSD